MVKWLNVTIDQVAHIEMGQSPSSVGYNAVGDGVPLIQGNADIINGKTVKRVWTSLITKTCEKSDIILTVRAPVGSVAYATEKACIGRGVCAIRPERIDRSFLFQYLLQFQSKWRRLEQGSTFTAINHKDVASFVLTIPESIEEQQGIAEILATCDEVIETTERLIEKYQAIKTGMLKDLMTRGIGEDGRLRPEPKEFPLFYKDTRLGRLPKTWNCKKIGDVFNCSVGGDLKLDYFSPFQTSEHIFPVFSNSLLNGGLYGFTKKAIFQKNSITITGRGDVGHAEFRSSDYDAIIRLVVLTPNSHNSVFCPFVSECINYLKNFFIESTGVPQLTAPQVANTYIILPPWDEQQKIATVLDGVDKKIQAEQKILTKYRQIKQGLLKQLLTPCNGVN